MSQTNEFENAETELIFTTSKDITIYENFQDMGLKMEILRGIFSSGFERPSQIQQRAIVPCYNGRDCVIQAQSGTGKTATFSIAAVQRVFCAYQENPVHKCRAIVLSPTRELATQSYNVLVDLSKHCQVHQLTHF
ncbi:eukaryotic initiation factor 4A-like [Octopus sinensis]|uniref:RNA helicase n=1 Tax=Octopus sinensis TaxID=2607531 RepID=A0A6P7U319_9MOLL|nr:eukaryotic initiation factor 4A-like [Octopus sinensis]